MNQTALVYGQGQEKYHVLKHRHVTDREVEYHQWGNSMIQLMGQRQSQKFGCQQAILNYKSFDFFRNFGLQTVLLKRHNILMGK